MAVFLITAPSGAGKTSIMNYIKKFILRDSLGECISHTSREMREGEVDGETYYFVSREYFREMYQEGEFAESVNYDGNLYGITKEEIERVQKKYKHVYIIVEFNGYKQVKEVFPDSVGIFLHMTKEDCMANMLLRGDSLDKAEKRIATYDAEMMNRYVYDYVVKNVRGKQDVTARIIADIVRQYEEPRF